MNKEIATFTCVLAALFCLTSALEVTNCGSAGEIISLTVDPCRTYLKGCELARNTNVTFTMRFRPNQSVNLLNHRVYGKVLGMQVPFRGIGPLNACPNVGGCPLQQGTEYVYTNRFLIRSAYPAMEVPIKYMLVSGQDDTSIICFEMDAKIVR